LVYFSGTKNVIPTLCGKTVKAALHSKEQPFGKGYEVVFVAAAAALTAAVAVVAAIQL